MNTITIDVDPARGTIAVTVPEPAGGAWHPASAPEPGKPAVQQPPPTQEQKAHYVFWALGTRERMTELIKAGPRAKETLAWLLRMRIAEAKKETGFQYQLVETTK